MKIIAMLQTFNDEDIIQEVIENILTQGLEIVVLDNGSSDRTYEICEKFLNRGVLKIHQYQSIYFDSSQNLKMVYDISLTLQPDWVVLVDSDEFLETGIKNTTLKEVIVQADKEDYNLIQFDWFEFFITDNDDKNAKSIKEKMKYYSYQGDIQYRAWKYFPGIFFGKYGGHCPTFPHEYRYKIYPKKMILKHYPFRSPEHAKRKMLLKLRGRREETEDSPPIDGHEKRILNQDFSAEVDHRILTEYSGDNIWNYQIKYNPFNHTTPPKKEDIFTEDGRLKEHQKTLKEYEILHKKDIKTINELKKKLAIQEKQSETSPIQNSKWPNFFIVGAPRCGTTSLFTYLNSVPGICMAKKKEPHFFADFSVPQDDPILKPVRKRREYLDLFQGEGDILGEASSHYLADRVAPFLIKKMLPNSKIIACLRDPIERAFSFYLHLKRGKWITDSFHDIITREIEQKRELNKTHSILRHGIYAENLKRYFKIFGRPSVKVLIFEEFIKRPKEEFFKLLEFLQISNPSENISYEVFNQGPSGEEISHNDIEILRKFYLEDIKQTEIILHRKLPWPNF